MPLPESPQLELYTTPGLLAAAREERILGVIADHSAIQTVIERGSQGKLPAGSVGALVLHNERQALTDAGIYPLESFDPEAGHPQAIGERVDFASLHSAVTGRHTLVVPVTAFHHWTAANALHDAASQYAKNLATPPVETEHPQRPPSPTENLIAGLGAVAGPLAALWVNALRPPDQREPIGKLAEEFYQEGAGEFVDKAKELARAADSLPVPGKPATEQMTPAELDRLVNNTPPLRFYPAKK